MSIFAILALLSNLKIKDRLRLDATEKQQSMNCESCNLVIDDEEFEKLFEKVEGDFKRKAIRECVECSSTNNLITNKCRHDICAHCIVEYFLF